MSNIQKNIFKIKDKELIERLDKVACEFNIMDNVNYQISILPGQVLCSGPHKIINQDPDLQKIFDCDGCMLASVNVSIGKDISFHVKRNDFNDTINIHTSDSSQRADNIKAICLVNQNFEMYERTEAFDKLLGDELAEFYRKREQALTKLEELSHQIIKKNEDYREETYKEFDELKKRLNDKIAEERNQLKEEFEIKEQKIKDRENELEKRSKDIDDNDNRTARRKIRLDLKDSLNKRSENFSLTESTNKKRNMIHGLFCFLITVPSIYILIEVVTIIKIGSCSLEDMARLGISSLAWFSAIIFYIRWNDLWFRQHADEEFKLKRMELDIDRASWVVEMTHEWKEEKGNDIPAKLIESLTRNLFEVDNTSKTTKHPTEDLASALFGAASNLTVKIPGLGEVVLSKNDVKKFKEAAEKANNA